MRNAHSIIKKGITVKTSIEKEYFNKSTKYRIVERKQIKCLY